MWTNLAILTTLATWYLISEKDWKNMYDSLEWAHESHGISASGPCIGCTPFSTLYTWWEKCELIWPLWPPWPHGAWYQKRYIWQPRMSTWSPRGFSFWAMYPGLSALSTTCCLLTVFAVRLRCEKHAATSEKMCVQRKHTADHHPSSH